MNNYDEDVLDNSNSEMIQKILGFILHRAELTTYSVMSIVAKDYKDKHIDPKVLIKAVESERKMIDEAYEDLLKKLEESLTND